MIKACEVLHAFLFWLELYKDIIMDIYGHVVAIHLWNIMDFKSAYFRFEYGFRIT
jgi:hypothetical protein